ncbi:MAG: hypothetical protein CMG27_00610, partial [Candidatus Marinimicrobia bacterium]|nr:hypothetical protein [Candidatus Neomarinimicrobiota bacterium]
DGKRNIEENFTLTFEEFPVDDKSDEISNELQIFGLKVINNNRLKDGKERFRRSDIIGIEYDVFEYNIVPYGSRENRRDVPVYLGALPWQDTKIDISVGTGNQVISWTMQPTFSGKRGIRVQDLMVVHILNESAKEVDENGKWTYPIYFASTVSPSNMISLNRYLKMEGLAFRVGSRPGGSFNYKKIKENLTTVVDDDWSRDYKVGYKYRNLDNPDVYYNGTTDIKLTQNWRHSFIQMAEVEAQKIPLAGTAGDTVELSEDSHAQAARGHLEMMEKLMPESVIPVLSPLMLEKIGEIYSVTGDDSLSVDARLKAASILEKENKWYPNDPTRFYQAGEVYLKLSQFDKAAGKYNAAIRLLQKKVQVSPNDERAQQMLSTCRYRLNQIDEFRRELTPGS